MARGIPWLVAKRSLSLNATFGQAVAALGGQPTREYRFGTAAQKTGDRVTPVRNLTELAEHFNAFEDFTGLTTISSQLERYQAFNAANHAFASDRLNLQAVLAGAGWDVRISQASAAPGVKLDGTANTIAALGLADTNGLRVGQLVAVQYKGLYVISAIVANTSVSLTTQIASPTTLQNNSLIAWLPVDTAVISANHINGTNTLQFAGTVPAAVQAAAPGAYQVAYINPTGGAINRDKDYRVAAADANTVTLDQNTTWGDRIAPVRIAFIPAITSGQVWSRAQFDLSCPDTFFALEFDLDLMAGASRDVQINGINTKAAFDALAADIPWGAWPACWLYGADNGAGFTSTDAEVDIMEMYWSTTAGPRWVQGNNHGNAVGKSILSKVVPGSWGAISGFNVKGASLAGPRKFQLVMLGGRTYRFVDGEMIRADVYDWSSQRPAQIGVNASAGALDLGQAANFGFPMKAAGFPSNRVGIKAIRVWHQPA